MSEPEPVKKKRKKTFLGVGRDEYGGGTTCICSDPKCDDAMAKLKINNPDRYAYFIIPKEPMEVTTARPPEEVMKRKMRATKRKRMLAALPGIATTRVNDDRYSSFTKFKIASLHVHDKIYDICTKSKSGRILLPESIPAAMARDLSYNNSCTFTSTDKLDDGSYVPLPNVSLQTFTAYTDDLEMKAVRAMDYSTPKQDRRTTRDSPVSSESIQNEQLQEQAARQAVQMQLQKDKLDKMEKALNKRKNELEKLQKEVVARQQDITEKLRLVAAGPDEIYGLTRSALLSKAWHKNHPDAANHLFGFKSWKELVYYFHALFHVLPPKKYVPKAESVSRFEQYLMSYMRIHTRMSIFQIALIWGRDRHHTGRLINNAVKTIGNAGKDLSILDITPEFLEATCPQQYKDEGLERCCAVPDGKDFMIYTTRKNTLFTRASYSDKVHHSAVRCISWSTPMGLSFEHTNLFLGRVSEKKLVELWGPRLAKCPRGWYMLSDRGFFDTARFYPNMNHQKTPKFLSGRDQFTEDEVSADRRICKLRYTCEVAFSRVTNTKGLRDVISNDFFPMLDAMNDWAHATVNLGAPLMK